MAIFLFVIVFLNGIFYYVYFGKSYAVFESNKKFNVINGTVSDPGDIYCAYYVDGEITRDMPKQNTGYTLNKEKSNCTNGVVPNWNNASWTFQANYSGYNATDYTRTRCNLYFEKTSKVVKTVIGDIEVNTYTPDFSKSACDDSICESHEKGIYETQDGDGTSYYYRGSVENNYVKFGGYYWRIIRINGNGSIRIIYDGTIAHDNGSASEDRYYSKTNYNSTASDNMYVGYMYTSGQVHGTGTSSLIKTSNDNFYKDKLINYANYIDTNTGFCGDRSVISSNTGTGTGSNYTLYGGYERLLKSQPSLKCESTSDYYTVNGSNKGNKALSYPVGLVTMDEVMYAGYAGGYSSGEYVLTAPNISSYINIGFNFYTMTPIGFLWPTNWTKGSYAMIYYIDARAINDVDPQTHYSFGLRPVINLKSTLGVNGSGTKNNPFIFTA